MTVRGVAGGVEEAGGFPVERGGDLQGDAGERLGGDVAQGDAGAHGEVGGGRGEAGVEVVGGEEEAERCSSVRTGPVGVGPGGMASVGGAVSESGVGGGVPWLSKRTWPLGAGGGVGGRGGLGLRRQAREEEGEGEEACWSRGARTMFGAPIPLVGLVCGGREADSSAALRNDSQKGSKQRRLVRSRGLCGALVV